MSGSSNSDCIRIRNLEVFCHQDLPREENVPGQKFVVSAALFTSTRKAGLSDRIEDSISCGNVCSLIRKEMTRQRDHLPERTAERIARVLLMEYENLHRVQIEIRKPWSPGLAHGDDVSVSIERAWHQVYIGVGSNMGDRAAYMDLAAERVRNLADCRRFRSSDILESEPYGYTNQDVFLNAVFRFETILEPMEVLDRLMEIEQEAGRTREIRWGPRTLDLDILLYDDLVTEDPHLIIPHPDMHNRMFVLEPLCQLNAYGVHPLLRERYIDIRRRLTGNFPENPSDRQ